MNKLAFVAAAATLLAFTVNSEASAQKGKGIPIKAGDGIVVKDSVKAQREANTHLDYGDKFRVSKQYDAAVKEYLKALKAYPNNDEIYKNLGGTYAQMGKWSEAESTLKQGTKLFPKEWLMWNNLAVVYLNLGKTEECKSALKTCLTLSPPPSKAEEMQVTLKALTSTKDSKPKEAKTTTTTSTSKTKTQ